MKNPAKKSVLKVVIFLSLILAPIMLSGQCYELVWAEEFNYRGLPDPETWTPLTGGDGFGNNEAQYYTLNDTDNVYVNDSLLVITALEEDYGGRSYTSARIDTRDKFSFQYGKIEARMKLPYGQGIWPAFWIMGQNIGEVGWPACGETDIMEMIGGNDRENTVYGTVHWDHNGDHASYGGSYTLDSGIFADTFHVFSVEWTTDFIKWYVDDKQYHVIDIRGAELSEFHQDFFILLNLAVGGIWPGYPDETTVFPQKLEVDYIRVYKSSSNIEDMEISGDDILAQHQASANYSLPVINGLDYTWSLSGEGSITSGQGSGEISVEWGCDKDTIKAEISGSCKTYSFMKIVDVGAEITGPDFIKENEENVLFIVPEMSNTTYAWNVPDDVTVIEGAAGDSLLVDWGTTFTGISVDLSNSCGDHTLTFNTVKHDQYPFPVIDEPHIIPGTIKAVDFDYGGEGLAYHDTSKGNSGNGPRQDTDVDTEYRDNGNPNVGWIIAGEYLEYSISVDSGAYYKMTIRSESLYTSGGIIAVYVNDSLRLDSVIVPYTTSGDQFQNIEAGTLELSTEDTLLKIAFIKGGINLSELNFSLTDPPVIIGTRMQKESVRIYPVPAYDHIIIEGMPDQSRLAVYDLQGKRIVQTGHISGSSERLDIHHLDPGIYIVEIQYPSGLKRIEKFIKSE